MKEKITQIEVKMNEMEQLNKGEEEKGIFCGDV